MGRSGVGRGKAVAVVQLDALCLAAVGPIAGVAPVWALFGVGSALIDPAYNSLISKAVPHRLRGTACGLSSTSIGIISLPVLCLGAMLWERSAPQFPSYVPLVATLLLLPIMWFKFKLPPHGPGAAQDRAPPS